MGKQFVANGLLKALVLLTIGAGPILVAAQEKPIDNLEKQWIEIQIERRAVVGDSVIRLTQDQEAALRWTTDEAAELHIHGYDIRFDISPDEPADVEFTAHATGRYAVTSHGFGDEHGHGHETLVYIEVYPN